LRLATTAIELEDSRQLLGALVFVGVLFALPMVMGRDPRAQYLFTISFWVLLYISLAAGWNVIGGYGGQFSFGHAAFYGVGAYAIALLALRGTNAFIALLMAPVLAGLLAVGVGIPSLRLRGPYFAITTLGIGETMRVVANNLEEVFVGGSSGIGLTAVPGWSPGYSHTLIAAVAATCLTVSYLVKASKFGLRLQAIREDEDAAAVLGVNVMANKLVAFMISAALVSLAGAAETLRTSYTFPDYSFGLELSVLIVLMTLIGGVGTFIGPVIGATIFTLLDQYFLVSFPYLHLLLYGSLLIAILIFEPNGLMGIWARFSARAGKS